jgi:tetratricopeptide (TPR) repeat protein
LGALADYDWAISLTPNLAAAYFARSLLKCNLLDDVRGANFDLDRALDLDPNIADDL